MKKILLYFAATVFGVSVAQSQELRLGAKVGVNFSSISGDENEFLSGLTSFHIGGLVEIPISEKFSIQPELLYSMQGATEEYSVIPNGGFGVKYENDLKLDYINIPIMAKYYVINGLSIEAGPQFGILVSAKAEGELTELEMRESESFDKDVKDSFKTFDIGFGLGASFRLDSDVFLSLRFNKGISQINEDLDYNHPHDYPGDYNYSYKQNNNVLQLSAGYFF